MAFSRRIVLKSVAGLGAIQLFPSLPAFANNQRHGLSVFGNLKYKENFKFFDYVDSEAPKGGVLSTVPASTIFRGVGTNQNSSSFDSFNMFTLKGNTPAFMDIIYDSLMTASQDEPDAIYGLIAKYVSVSNDGNRYNFYLNDSAHFHDGSPITAEDIVFTLTNIKKNGHPIMQNYLKYMDSIQARNPYEVSILFNGSQSPIVPIVIAQLPIVSRKFHENYAFEKTSLTIPLGCGPYKIVKYKKDLYVEFERVKDYWAQHLPVNVGRFNFDIIRMNFFRERAQSFEAFKASEYWLREEFTSRYWANEYDFPNVRKKIVKQEVLPDHTPSGMQGWFMNSRRPHLADSRVRQAIGLMFDFEWSNRVLFYGAYQRTFSYFQNSQMEAHGRPSSDELALLEPYREHLAGDIFNEAYLPPKSDGSGQDRRLFRQALTLLQQAGWQRVKGQLRNRKNEKLSIEFLDDNNGFSHISGPFIASLKKIGIDAKVRIVDSPQYRLRIQKFDFDVITSRFSMSLTPGEGLRQFWHSSTRDQHGSYNYSGIADPVMDALLEKLVDVADRKSLMTIARVIDRILRSGHYWIPQWYKGSHTIAYRDVYSHSKKKPRYARGVVDCWWYDQAKADRL